ncbi:MAG: magnesium protoporphyrin IX methyltransferase [Rhizobiaceae bacterium]|jgi:magnesium-protoporphyrin O-methyltransferase|nr:magnesium protoporphyrin IX methyltransferase [Rhizobiaceae bacterium]
MLADPGYTARRDTIRTYFDRTALDAWKRFATDAPMGRVRATVRAGRAEMRAEILNRFPADLRGWRILDAGCGAGALAIALAERGADVTGIDLSPELVGYAREALPKFTNGGAVRLHAGDMLTRIFGRFDAVVAMDSIIHYTRAQALEALLTLAGNTNSKIVFTHAPRTPLLSAMHAAGKLFPRSDRSPMIEPVAPQWFARALRDELGADGWHVGDSRRIQRGFYISNCMELARDGNAFKAEAA